MSKITTLQQVVAGGLCTGCGLCESLAGRGRIEMRLTSGGHLRPAFRAPPSTQEHAELLAVCPGYSARGPGDDATPDGGFMHPIWGPVRRIDRGWASDPLVRHRASAGGVLTALGEFLLASARVDAVLHVRASESNPMLTDALVSRSREDVLSGMQSRYGPSAPLVHVHRQLDEGGTFAVIAKPCDVAAIRNLARLDARVHEQISYLLTIFCGGVPNSHVAEAIAAHHGLSPDQVAVFRFRGEGWPGATHIEARDGTTHELTYEQAWFEPQPWRYDVQWRCKICPDAIGELADVSVPDGWILSEDGRPLHQEAPGVNVILERTAAGSELVQAAVDAGYLERSPLAPAEFERMHRDHRVRRLGEPARLAAVRITRAAAPDVRGYRLGAVLRTAPLGLLLSQFLGAVRRIRSGQAREPVEDRTGA